MTDQWPERREASFRGVPFLLQTVRGKTGRRALAHEFPKSNQGSTEDNGGVLNAETIQAVLVGPSAESDFQRLIEALNVAGPGELIHPYFGIRQVQIGEVDYDLDNNERDICRLSFQVYAASSNLFPTERVDTQQAVSEQATQANEAQCECFAADVSEMSPEEVASLGDKLDGMLDDMDNMVNNLPGLPDEIGEWVGRVDRMKFSLGRALAYPGTLARELTGHIFRIKDLATELPLSLNVYGQLIGKWQGLREELSPTTSGTTDTPAQARKKAVERVGVDLMLTAAVTGKANAVASGALPDTKEAENAASSLATEIAYLANIAVESGNSDGWRVLRKLRVSVVQDVQARAKQLPTLRTVTIDRAMPSALLAYQLTGDTNQRDDMVTRNRLSRPSFVVGTVDVVEKLNG